MTTGTKTVLFGTHQFLIHPVFVLLAWLILYRRFPKFYELCAIVTHDLGYWGCPNVDGGEGEQHPERVAQWWRKHFNGFGELVANEVLGHSRFYSKLKGLPLSPLFRADKLAPTLYPRWMYLLMGTLSGEIAEYMEHCRSGKYRGEVQQHRTAWSWMHAAFGNMGRLGFEGMDVDGGAK